MVENSLPPRHQVYYKATTTTVVKYNYASPSSETESTEQREETDDTINNNTEDTKPEQFMNKGNLPPSTLGFGPTTTTTTTTFNFNQNPQQRSQGDNRPPFITTVTRGRFLPSKFDLLVERNFFTFSSRPRPVGLTYKPQSYSSNGFRSEKNRPSSPPRGIHDYFNLMWDPHVVRGSTVKVQTAYMDPNQSKSRQRGENPEEPKVRKKRSNNVLRTRVKPSYSVGSSNRSRQSPPPVTGRLHTMIQTEKQFLEELGGETTEESSDATVQTDEIYEMCLPPSYIPHKSGIDASTQVLPDDLFDFDAEVEPVLESLVENVMEQSMYEVVQEEELLAIKEQRNRFQEQRRQEEKELRQLQEQKQKIDAEKERLKKQLELEHILGFENGTIESRDRRSTYSTSYILELLPSVLNSLRQEGFLPDFVTNENEDCGEFEAVVSGGGDDRTVEEVTSSVNDDDNAVGGEDEVFANNTIINSGLSPVTAPTTEVVKVSGTDSHKVEEECVPSLLMKTSANASEEVESISEPCNHIPEQTKVGELPNDSRDERT